MGSPSVSRAYADRRVLVAGTGVAGAASAEVLLELGARVVVLDRSETQTMQRLRSAGLMDDGGLTEAGREHREEIELATDAQMAPAVEALGDDLQELVDLLTPWDLQIMQGAGYPPSPLAITPGA